MLHVKNIICIFALWIGWFGHQPIRGKSITPSTSNLIDVTKRIDEMGHKKNINLLLADFREVHGDMYDYSLVNDSNYQNNCSVIPIICKVHGVFKQLVTNHLQCHGCPSCAKARPKIKKRKLVCGVGFLDIDYSCCKDNKTIQAYNRWYLILSRCYNISPKYQKRYFYKDCSVCDEWLYFSNFKRWFDENYIDGYDIDKDILKKGNKIYSPATCCFVPKEINKLLLSRKKLRGACKIGVSKVVRGNSVRYHSYYNENGKRINIGYFKDEESAFIAYKQKKEEYIKRVASQYYNDGKIGYDVYNALMNYIVEKGD